MENFEIAQYSIWFIMFILGLLISSISKVNMKVQLEYAVASFIDARRKQISIAEQLEAQLATNSAAIKELLSTYSGKEGISSAWFMELLEGNENLIKSARDYRFSEMKNIIEAGSKKLKRRKLQ